MTVGGALLLAVGACVLIGVWVRFVMLGDGERELRRIEGIWGEHRSATRTATVRPNPVAPEAGPARNTPTCQAAVVTPIAAVKTAVAV